MKAYAIFLACEAAAVLFFCYCQNKHDFEEQKAARALTHSYPSFIAFHCLTYLS